MRYYEQSYGRYIRKDPLGLLAGVNLYSYVKNNPLKDFDPFGLICKIEFGEPVPGKDPVGWRNEEKTIGYWDAVAQRLLYEYLVAKLTGIAKKIGVPLPPVLTPTFTYIIRHRIYVKYYYYVQYWEVCYDDCTGDEISRDELEAGKIDRTIETIYEEWTERKFL
jgi:uncharacterized protein RhaS with RHS repeats